MLVLASDTQEFPVLSLHVGGAIGFVRETIIDPENLQIAAFIVDGPLIKNDPEIGNILLPRDIREFSPDGYIIDSTDRLVFQEDIVRLEEIMELNFDVIGLKVETSDKRPRKLGKVVDYTFDSETFMIYQIIVQRNFMKSFVDSQLTINRSQIVELDDYTIKIKHDKQQIKLENEEADFVPNFVNPFRKQDYAPEEESITDSSSTMSE